MNSFKNHLAPKIVLQADLNPSPCEHGSTCGNTDGSCDCTGTGYGGFYCNETLPTTPPGISQFKSTVLLLFLVNRDYLLTERGAGWPSG